jgi:hypothetical protein
LAVRPEAELDALFMRRQIVFVAGLWPRMVACGPLRKNDAPGLLPEKLPISLFVTNAGCKMKRDSSAPAAT